MFEKTPSTIKSETWLMDGHKHDLIIVNLLENYGLIIVQKITKESMEQWEKQQR